MEEISLFLKVRGDNNPSYFSDDSLIYQAILTGMVLIDAIHYTDRGVFCNHFNDSIISEFTKGEIKKLYEEGVEHLYWNQDTLYLFVTNATNYKIKRLSWCTSIPKGSTVPVVSHILPGLLLNFTFSGDRGDFTEIHITSDTINLIEFLAYQDSKALGLTEYYVDGSKEINCIEWERYKNCGKSKMSGWNYLSFTKNDLYDKMATCGFLKPLRFFLSGEVKDSRATRAFWVTKVRGSNCLGKTENSLYTFKHAPYFPEKLSDIRDILLKVYKNKSKVISNSLNSESVSAYLRECEYDYVKSIISSLRITDRDYDLYKNRAKNYFNTFLYYLDNQERDYKDISTREMKHINNSKDKKMKDGMFGNMMEKFKSMIVPVTDPNLKITMDGNVAVRNGEGEYVSINADNELVNYPADFTISVPIYVMKKPFVSIQLGEIVKKGNSYAKVIGKNPDGTLKCLSFTGYTTTKKGITDFMLGASYADVVVNIMNIQNAGVNPMMLALMNNDGNMSSKELMMFMMMSGGMNMNNGMNPMMLMMLAGDKDGDGSMSKMLEVLMMSQMFGGGNMGGGMNMFGNMGGGMNMFGNQGGQMPNPFQMFNFGGKKACTKKAEDTESEGGQSEE